MRVRAVAIRVNVTLPFWTGKSLCVAEAELVGPVHSLRVVANQRPLAVGGWLAEEPAEHLVGNSGVS
jgi:hypothetical protein